MQLREFNNPVNYIYILVPREMTRTELSLNNSTEVQIVIYDPQSRSYETYSPSFIYTYRPNGLA